MRNVRQALRLVQQGGQRGSAAGKLISTTTTTAQRQLASTAARVIGSQYAGSSSAAAATSSTTAASTLQQQQQQQSLLGRRTFAESKTLGTPAEAAAQSKATSTATTAGGVDAEYIRTAIQKMLQENEKANHKKKKKNKKGAAVSNGTEASSTATKAEKYAGAAKDSGATSESAATATVVVSDEDLVKHADKFQYRLDEAKSCVLDCAELVAVGTDREEWGQGYDEAEVAIGSCVASLIEFLELLNATTDEAQLRRYDALRQSSTVSLKELRQQLKDFENQYKQNNSPNSQNAK